MTCRVDRRLLPPLFLRDGHDNELPIDETLLRPGDQMLFAGTRAARTAQNLALDNQNVLGYVLSGKDAQGWIWRQLGRLAARQLSRRPGS